MNSPFPPSLAPLPIAPSARRTRGHVQAMAKVTPKLIYYRDETAQKLIAGINAVANVVKATLGPRGRNVVLMRDVGYPEVINDGVTIARDINLPDPAMQVGAKLIKAVASKSDSIAGDGTTTSTLMTQVLINKVSPPSCPPSLSSSHLLALDACMRFIYPYA